MGVENLRAQVAGAGPWERLELQVRASEVVLAHAGPVVGQREPLRPLGEESWCQAWGLLLGDRQLWRHSVETKEPWPTTAALGMPSALPRELPLKTTGSAQVWGPASAPGLDQAAGTQCCPHLACPEHSIRFGLERRASNMGRALLRVRAPSGARLRETTPGTW